MSPVHAFLNLGERYHESLRTPNRRIPRLVSNEVEFKSRVGGLEVSKAYCQRLQLTYSGTE